MSDTTNKYEEQIKIWTDYTYDLGIFEGCWRVVGDAIYDNTFPFNELGMDDSLRYEILGMFHSIYSLVAKVNANLIKGITQMKAGEAVSITLEPYVIPDDSWPMPPENPTLNKDTKPSVVKDLWSVIDPIIGKFLIAYKGDPLMIEVLQALQSDGQKLVDSLDNIINGSK